MVRVRLSSTAADHLDRIFDHLARVDVNTAAARCHVIRNALSKLAQTPMIGRPVSSDIRELLIGSRHHGYIARYRYVAGGDLVLILAIRSQRQAGYP